MRDVQVDFARTIAILMVVLGHTTNFFYGRFGVQLFFCISGFCLASSIKKFYSIKEFLLHRFVRLAPLSFLFLIIFYWSQLNSRWDKLLNITLLQGSVWNVTSFPGGWSISLEWIFSIFMVFGLVKIRPKILLLFIAVVLIIQTFFSIYVLLQGGLDLKQLISEHQKKMLWLNTTNPIGNLSCFLFGIFWKKICFVKKTYFLPALFFLFGAFFDFSIGHFLPLQAIAICSLFILCLQSNLKYLQFGKIVSLIGQRTYGIFFSHFLIQTQIDPLLQNLFGIEFLKNIASFIVTWLIAIWIGGLTLKFIEKPCVKLLDAFIKKNRLT